MISIVGWANLLMYALIISLFWIAAPLPKGNRLYNFRTLCDTSGVGRIGAFVTGIVLIIGLLVPAVLGWAPFNIWPPAPATSFPELAYPGFYIFAIIPPAASFGFARVYRALSASTKQDLTSPPTEGQALITATARAPDDAPVDEDREDVDSGLVHDYRLNMLIRSGVHTDVENLKRARPFVLEGPAGSIRVDTTDAHVSLYGRYTEDRRIEDGDEITVLGTVRVDSNGQWYMSGEEDFLYLSNETPAKFRRRILKGLVFNPIWATIGFLVSGAILNPFVGFV